MEAAGMNDCVATLRNVTLRYRDTVALDDISLDVPAGCTVGLIGPDGVGKSSLLSLIAGARRVQEGSVQVLGGDMADRRDRNRNCTRIAYMPQGLGKNLYPTLSVEENLQFFGRLFGHEPAERRRRIDELTTSTGLHPFLDRPAGKLSGGMKQKLGLCCALIHDPDLLILDEPTTGVDPLARAQFWELIARIRDDRPGMSVLVATAYMDEAQRFDLLVAMDAGRILATGTPRELLARTGSDTLEAAFVALLPQERRQGHAPVEIPPLEDDDEDIAIEADGLTMRFGDFVAVDHVSFRIRRGEIFGFLGSNGCGKSTTMKMLTGLLPASEGRAWLFGKEIDTNDMDTRARVGYMSQSFSLYSELTVHQNLMLHAQLFHVPAADREARVNEMLERFELTDERDALPAHLPLGLRQRLSLAVAMVHRPEILILDEPTSGVDPVARDAFWRHLIELSRRDRVTIFISTHFMNEAERCDRMSMMHAGKVLDSDRPAALVEKRGAKSLEEAFIGYLVEASEEADEGAEGGDAARAHEETPKTPPAHESAEAPPFRPFSLGRLLSYCWRESLELRRDPIRATLALGGSLLLMLVIGFGINLDVEDLSYAVLDRDQTTVSNSYTLNLAGSRYFSERPPVRDYDDLDRRMRNGELALVVEIPPGFGRDVTRGTPVQIGAWVDGAMPARAETLRGYVQGIHQHWLMQTFPELAQAESFSLETRYRYNPDVRSLPAMVPAVIPLLLMMLPAMLSALSVVREKELGSIINLYVTPVTRSEFLLGKQLPYIGLAMINYLAMCLMAVTLFGVPMTGSFLVLTLATLVYVICSTGLGLLFSAVTRSQIAALFLTMMGTLLPAVQFSGLMNPVSALEGMGRVIGELYPASHMFVISRGVFNKALGMAELGPYFWPMIIAIPVILGLAVATLRKQETYMRRSLLNIWRLGIKELWSLWREPVMLVLIVYLFTVALYSAATAMPETLHNSVIAIVDEDRSPLSTRITSAFYPPHFRPPVMVSHEQIDPGMDSGEFTFALTIPSGFQRDVLGGRHAELQLNVDATRMSQAFSGSGYVQQIVSAEVAEFVARHRQAQAPPVDLALRMRFNPTLETAWFGSVMEMVNSITMLSIILTGAALIREREHGTIEHLLVMPVTPTEIMIAKVWSMGLVVMIATAVSITLVIRGAIGVPIQGSLALFFVGVALSLFATTSMGIFLATVARSMPQFGLLLVLTLLPLQMLSGGSTPRESMPEAVQAVMLAAPTTHFVSLSQAILARGAGLETVWPSFVALLIIGAVLFSYSLWRFRKVLARMA